MKNSIFLSALMVGLLFAGCKKSSNSGGSQTGMSYEMVATNTNYSVARTTSTANVIWTSGYAHPDVVTFTATQNNLQVQFKSTNNGQIDLFAPVAVAFGNFSLPAGIYNNISLKIDLDKNGQNPVLQLNGQVTNDTVTIPVELQITQSVTLQTDESNVTITNDSSYLAVTDIDLSTITAGITAYMLLNAQLTNGTIVISTASNEGLYDLVVDNLANEHHHCDFEGHHH